MISEYMIGIKGKMIKARNALKIGGRYKVTVPDPKDSRVSHTEVWRCDSIYEHGALFVSDRGLRHFLNYQDILLRVS